MGAETLIQNLLDGEPLREPLFRSIIRTLNLPVASHGLDAGCGIGLPALLLAEAIGADGHVTGMDILPELLSYGERLAAEAGLSGRITFQEGDIFTSLPFAENTFDWVWSADCIGNPIGELVPTLKELIRVVKPGGNIILLTWTSQQILPGYPLLEARLNATCSSYLPFFKDKSKDQHFLRVPHWFGEVGLEEIKTRTFTGEVLAPLSNGERTALVSLFDMLWSQPQPETLLNDWKEVQRLCVPGSADFILDQPGYYAFFTYTLFQGKVPTR